MSPRPSRSSRSSRSSGPPAKSSRRARQALGHCYEYPRPAVAVDAVVLAMAGDDLQIMLIQRDQPPFAGRWALPGGFVRMDESLDEAVRRELQEETGLCDIYLDQVGAFGAVDRDPRDRVVSVAYVALVQPDGFRAQGAGDARCAAWFRWEDRPRLAFDHAQICQAAMTFLQRRLRYAPIGFELLPEKFPLRDLQAVYERLLGRPLDKRNFRRRVLELGILRDTGRSESGTAHRAARLYRFNKAMYDALLKKGIDFEW